MGAQAKPGGFVSLHTRGIHSSKGVQLVAKFQADCKWLEATALRRLSFSVCERMQVKLILPGSLLRYCVRNSALVSLHVTK